MKIVIIGAGVGGVLAVHDVVKKLPHADVTLIDNSNYFVFTPRLTEVLSEKVQEKWIVRPTDVFEAEHVHTHIGTVTSVDTVKRLITVKEGLIPYDYLIFAQGATTNYFGLQGPKKYCLPFKDYEDVDILKEKILEGMREINRGKRKKFTVALVGGGPTAVEVAFALYDFVDLRGPGFLHFDRKNIEVVIYQSGPTLVPNLPKPIIRKVHEEAKKAGITISTGYRVVDVKPGKLFFKNQQPKTADIVLWMAGVRPNTISGTPVNQHGYIEVENTLQVKGIHHAFALGDCCTCLQTDGVRYPPTAQIAAQQASLCVKNLVRLIDGKKLKSFTYKTRGWFVVLGYGQTAATAFGIPFSGWSAWHLRDQYYKSVFRKLIKKM